jgi:hypothetical protein
MTVFVSHMELSSIAEINQECLSFLKDCATNTVTFKSLWGNLLTFATVYGEKLDDCVISDKKKMRKEFGDTYIKFLSLAFNQNPIRQTSPEGRKLVPVDSDIQSDDDMRSTSKPGTPGMTLNILLTIDLSGQEFPSASTKSASAPREILKQLSGNVIPKLRAVLDNERGLAACSLIMNSIIGPALRKRTLYSISLRH